MIVNMLEAVSDMLFAEGTMDVKEFQVRVACAKTILDKVIDGLKDKPELMPAPHYKSQDVKIQNHTNKEPEYQISVEHGKLVYVKVNTNGEWQDAPHDMPMLIDEILTSYGEAIGKPFQNGQVL